MIEQHYTPQQVAEKLSLSVKTVHRLFRDQPGCFKPGPRAALRISESALNRVYNNWARGFSPSKIKRGRG